MTEFNTALAETTINVSGTLTDIYPGTTKTFTITVTDADDEAVDISGDTMTFRLKRRKGDLDTAALIERAASSLLVTGVASFTLTITDTDVTPGNYYADIEWVTAGGLIYIVYDKEIKVLERTSDA
jgi:hypothetical protein